MERAHRAELVHLLYREIAHADGADRALLVELAHGARGLGDRAARIGPVHLIDVDAVGLEPLQRVFDLAHDALAAAVARDLAVVPFEPDLGGDERVLAQAAGERLAHDLLGAAEAVDRRGVYDVDTVGEGGPDGRDRPGLVGATPHPAADRPSPQRHARDPEPGAGNVGVFHERTG